MYLFEYLTIGILFLNTLIIALLVIYFLKQESFKSYLSPDAKTEDEFEDIGVGEQLSIQEHILLREEAHDKRVAEFKEELARSLPVRTDDLLEPAIEGHPNVKNLPHNIIHTKGYNGIEISE